MRVIIGARVIRSGVIEFRVKVIGFRIILIQGLSPKPYTLNL